MALGNADEARGSTTILVGSAHRAGRFVPAFLDGPTGDGAMGPGDGAGGHGPGAGGSLGPGDDPSPRQASEGASRNHMNASMKAYNGVPVPEGELIQAGDGKFFVPDHPIIPFIEGDGTAPDIW